MYFLIRVLETSFLWSLVDKEDGNHKKAVEWISSESFGNVCILPTVVMEFQARYNIELNKLISTFITILESESSSSYDLASINRFIDQAHSKLLTKTNIAKSKLNKYRVNLHEYCRKLFKGKTKLYIKDLKASLTSLSDKVNDLVMGSVNLLLELGYRYPKIDGRLINEKLTKIIEHGIKFKGTGDSMIAGELICLSGNSNGTNYEFISFDDGFRKLLDDAIDRMNIDNLKTYPFE